MVNKYMINKINLFKIFGFVFFLMMIINVSACASGQAAAESNNKTVGPLFSYNNTNSNAGSGKISGSDKYKELLVDIREYSTNGGYYQKKYEKNLLSIAGEIVEDQDLDVSKKSVGFYYDKISEIKDRLFLGLDIDVEKENNLDYGKFSVNIIKENVNGIIDLMYKYNFILSENEIVGIVIGFKWKEGKNSQLVNIWMNKEDIKLFYNRKITINELYQRSTITNSTGKIILLPI
ncbi:MAG: hypothetical protein FWH53_06765 [Leptospirales bacterium]|nr:hypothetical protein [Leptospirales bacterium]